MNLDLEMGQQTEGGFLAELIAKLDVHIGATKRLADAMERRKPPAQPVFGRTAGTGLFVTGAPLVISFPLKGPDQGHFWYVRSIVVGGLSPTVSTAVGPTSTSRPPGWAGSHLRWLRSVWRLARRINRAAERGFLRSRRDAAPTQ